MGTVVFAPDSFKGSIGAAAAAAALAEGWARVRPDDDVVLRPMADGGEGTLDAFAAAVPGARRMPATVTGPDGRAVAAEWVLLPHGVGVVELASTSGIEVLGDRLRPLDSDTTGFGEAIVAAIDHGVSQLVLGIGSSASTDGGTGLLTALGARFTDSAGQPVRPGLRGLVDIAAVDLTGLRVLPPGGAVVLSDVTNPLTGPSGAATVFGPQKGLDSAGVIAADAHLRRYADLFAVDPATPGAGAAGGAGFGLVAWGARLQPGAAAVARLVDLAGAVAAAEVVVTGEGAYDASSAHGKAPAHVIELARAANVPVMVVAGRLAVSPDVAVALSLTDLAGTSHGARENAAHWLRVAGAVLAARRPAASRHP